MTAVFLSTTRLTVEEERVARTTPLETSVKLNMSSDLRKRQTKKDEVIRQKMEKDLAKKRPTAARSRTASRKAAPGTVSSLKPTPPMTVPADMTVHEGILRVFRYEKR